MKGLTIFAVSILVAVSLLTVLPVYGEAEIYNDVLRLHVIAESDSEEDQALKLKVRDAVLLCVSERVGDCETYDEAYAVIDGMREEILKTAENCVQTNGKDYAVTIELGQEKYPRREYDNVALPAGVYNSLRITLGDGNGKNWWCILFPTICTPFATAEKTEECVAVGFTPSEYRMITGESGEVKIRFKLLEVLSEVFNFSY